MSLLDGGVARVFSGVFGAFYPDGMLHRQVRTEAAGGSIAETYDGIDESAGPGIACKVQRDRVTWAMRQAQGYAEGDVQFIILAICDGVGLPEPKTGWRLTWQYPDGDLYSLEGDIGFDAAASHYTARGRLVR